MEKRPDFWRGYETAIIQVLESMEEFNKICPSMDSKLAIRGAINHLEEDFKEHLEGYKIKD